LAPGETLAIFSEGLMKAASSEGDVGARHLLKALGSSIHSPARGMVNGIEAMLEAVGASWVGSTHRTVVVLKTK
jgi:hypothetical protein